MSQIFFENLSRVHTFTTSNWIYIDQKQMSPYLLASKGYYLSNYLLLQCSVCHNQVRVNSQLEANYQDILIQLKNHNENCIFNENNQTEKNDVSILTKEQIYLLMDEIIIQIKQSHKILLDDKTFPILNRVQIEKHLKKDIFTLKFVDQAYRLNYQLEIKILFFLQFFGWTAKKDFSQNVCLRCAFCGRQVSISKLKLIQKDSQLNSQIFRQEQYFDPIAEHRYFCFWVHQNQLLGVEGWQILLQHYYDKINESKSLFTKRPAQQTKKIRVELDKYLQTFKNQTSQKFNKIKSIFNECEQLRKELAPQVSNEYNIFDEINDNLNNFIEEDVNDQIKGQIKKIKLN